MDYKERIAKLETELELLKNRKQWGAIFRVRSDKWTHERTFDNLEDAMCHYNYIRNHTPNKAIIKKTGLYYDSSEWETLSEEE